MKLQTKFYLGIIIIFTVLAIVIAAISIDYVNTNTIREAEDRVKIYARAAWEIYNSNVERIRSTAQVIAQRLIVQNLLAHPEDERQANVVQQDLEAIRQEHKMDILNLLAPDGTVILRTRFPYNKRDSLANDPLVREVVATQQSVAGSAIFELERLDIEGAGLIERALAIDKEPRGMFVGAAVPVMDNGRLIGIVQMGSLLNGSVEQVDRIRDAVFKNEYYQGKPVGTATVFMDDLRISTNVQDNQGRRAVGTRVSRDVAERVLEQGLSWTGPALVVDTWYLSQYDPIKDPEGNIIGMLYVGELQQKYLDLRTRSVILYLSVILGGMLLAFAIVFFVTRGILGPIRTLVEATRRLSSGNLSHRVAVRSKDKIGDLSACFNEMAERLEQQRQELEHSQREMEALNNELRSINRNYMEMLGFVSHELKNPLASAVMSLYTVKDGYLGAVNPAQKRSLESTAQSLGYFQDMIQDYLDLSRLEKGELEVRKSLVPLSTHIVAPVLEGLEPELHQRNMMVENHIPEDMTLCADGSLLRIVYNNLLSNAAKYGRTGGRLVLDAQEADNRIILSIRNDGEGIPPEQMSMLFRKFSRLDAPERAGQRGTGLGLYICKELMEKQGGGIWADSQRGEWIKFSFWLPK